MLCADEKANAVAVHSYTVTSSPSTILNQAPFNFIYFNFGHGHKYILIWHIQLSASLILWLVKAPGHGDEIHATTNILTLDDEPAERVSISIKRFFFKK